MKYVVEVHGPVLETPQTLMRKLVEQFDVRTEVARELMKLIPGTVTKPVSEKEATTISSMLSRVGLKVSTHLVGTNASGITTLGIATLKITHPVSGNPGVLNPIAAPSVTLSPATASRRNSILSQVLVSSILLVLLTVATALWVILQTVPPTLQTQLLASARTPAIALASVAERVIGANDISSKPALGELDAAIEDARGNFQQQDIRFVIVTDTSGQPLAGWYGNDSEMDTIPATLSTAIRAQSHHVTSQDYANTNALQPDSLNRTVEADGLQLEVVAEAIEINGQPVGAVVVGVDTQSTASTMSLIVNRTFLAGALPLILALLLGVFLRRSVTRNLSV
jgi:hypothetical protein